MCLYVTIYVHIKMRAVFLVYVLIYAQDHAHSKCLRWYMYLLTTE